MDVEGRGKVNKRKAMKNVDPLSNQVTNNMEEFGTLGPSFASISIEKLWP